MIHFGFEKPSNIAGVTFYTNQVRQGTRASSNILTYWYISLSTPNKVVKENPLQRWEGREDMPLIAKYLAPRFGAGASSPISFLHHYRHGRSGSTSDQKIRELHNYFIDSISFAKLFRKSLKMNNITEKGRVRRKK